MVVQHNLTAMNANRQLSGVQSAQQKSTEKLSSGYRINRAGDDAAGLSISEKMRSQIRGLNKAASNAQDGISLVQVAEGALNETHSILQRMNELATQAANAGFGDLGSFDKTSLNKELSMINVNIKATHILTKYMVKTFKKRNLGYIMNVASSAGLLPGGPYMSTYYATKSYVTSLTSAINEELREAKSRVHICMLCPGPVNTNFNNVANVTFALPGISATYCASYALRQMFRGKVTIVPTLMMKLGTTVAKCVPRQMVTAITARQQKKKIM